MQFTTGELFVCEVSSTTVGAESQSGLILRSPDELAEIVLRFASSTGWLDRVRLRTGGSGLAGAVDSGAACDNKQGIESVHDIEGVVIPSSPLSMKGAASNLNPCRLLFAAPSDSA
jgi:hypothetical protein